MKLGLLTFHDAANYGAVLQAYALQAYLQGEGFDCEYLNYRSERRRRAYDMGFHIRSNLRRGNLAMALKYALGRPFMERRKRRFDAFRKACLQISAREYRTAGDLNRALEGYDKFIVGSDQVWNPGNNGADTAFLLDFVPERNRKISYASSFGADTIPDALRARYASCLEGIGHLSVRERAGCRLVKELTGRDVPSVVDPVFLLGRKQWEQVAGTSDRKGRPFVFSYTNHEGQAEGFFRQTGYRLDGMELHKLSRQTSPRDFLDPKVKIAYSMSPEEFLRNVRDAELVLTASFHCLAFSLLFNKPFVCFLSGNSGKDERLAGLLKEVGLENRVFRPGLSLEEVSSPIDYGPVNAKLAELVAQSAEFLNSALAAP
jgi:hypothetical protein